MSDLAQSNVHGPVEALRTEWAEWDPAKQEWHAPKQTALIRFRPDGQIADVEDHGQDGSVSRTTYIYNEAGQILETRSQTGEGPVSKIIHSYDGSGRIARTIAVDENGTRRESEIYRYDAGGRKTRVQFLPEVEANMAYSMEVEGALALFGAGGATTMTTAYDNHGQAAEVLIHDAAHRLLRRLTLTRDSAGRLVKEEVDLGTGASFPDTLATIFGANNALSKTYAYDQKGRQVERTMSMGMLGEHRTTFRFDDHDNPIEEIDENSSRDVQMDEQGHPHPHTETTNKQHIRYVYKYDANGNWTAREVGTILEASKEFKRSNIERRQITYYQPGLR